MSFVVFSSFLFLHLQITMLIPSQRLTVPEVAPFRLTRNVIDGMGSLGVEGTFTKAAEATLSTLKQNSNGLLTILSAIVSDPLYKWSLSSKKVNRQNEEGRDENGEYKPQLETNNFATCILDHNENRNEVATHAISRIQEKLLGYEDGTLGEQQSVESQVQLLLNAAQDPDNLCVMYPGWAPWQ
jgi:serine-protein kinase ATM